MPLVALSEIKTVTQLYQDQSLKAVATTAAGAVSVKSNPSYNDRIGLFRGDITKLKVDAIVNAANNSLLGGGGVDGAIHAGAGPDLLKECAQLKGCRTGSAKITDAYELPCKRVIHAVGPIYNPKKADDCENDLRGCYQTSLELATKHGCKSIAFSALSTGVYGYPSNDAAPVAIRTVKEFLEGEDASSLERVIFCTFVQKDVDAYNKWIPWVGVLVIIHLLTLIDISFLQSRKKVEKQSRRNRNTQRIHMSQSHRMQQLLQPVSLRMTGRR